MSVLVICSFNQLRMSVGLSVWSFLDYISPVKVCFAISNQNVVLNLPLICQMVRSSNNVINVRTLIFALFSLVTPTLVVTVPLKCTI